MTYFNFFKKFKKLFSKILFQAIILAIVVLMLFSFSKTALGWMVNVITSFSGTSQETINVGQNQAPDLANQNQNQPATLSDQNQPAAPADDLAVQSGPNPSDFIAKPFAASSEITASRTENSKTFDNHDGTYTYKAVIGLAHYKDDYSNSNEPWKDIDTSYYTDYPEYRLYDHLPTRVKVFKNKTGYEIESKRTGQKYTVLLDEVAGAKTDKKINDADSDFEFEIKASAVRLWKNLKTASAPKKFTWKVTKQGDGDLSFRENPEAFEIGTKKDIKINTKKTAIDENSFYWEETAPKTGVKIDTDVNVSIAASTDDCQEAFTFGASTSFLTGQPFYFLGSWEDIEYGEWGTYDVGTRFLNITIPNSATINSATISFVQYSAAGSPSATIKGIAEDNTATWSSGSKPTNRTKTSASVSWSIPGTMGTVTTPSIVSIVQEIVNRAGWASGNAIGFVAEGYNRDADNGANAAVFRSYDYGSSIPTLDITYTAAGGGSSATATTTVIMKKNTIFKRNVIFK